MRLKVIALLSLVIIFFTFCSCKKNILTEPPTPEKPAEVPVVIPPTTIPGKPEIPADTVIELGTGSGNLTIDGSKINFSGNILIKIKSGSYSSINLKNIQIADGKKMTVKNTSDGIVYVKEEMSLNNVKNLIVSGDGSKDQYGFQFLDLAYRCIRINNFWSGVEINRARFTNNRDYCISVESTIFNKTYTGTADTRTENIKIIGCEFDNTGTIYFGGELNKDTNTDIGFVKGLEVAYCTFKNGSPGDCIKVGNVEGYNIHHNTFNNINSYSNIHNGIVFVIGDGDVHHNICTNHQGNFVRAWVYSREGVKTSKSYNNIIYNSRKYSAFEYQAFSRHMWGGKTTYTNVLCYNNTVGKMNTSLDWIGNVIDIYNLAGGSIEVFNNVGINFGHPFGWENPAGQQNYITNIQANQAVTASNNSYFATLSEAGILNDTDFKISGNSALKAKGKNAGNLLEDDFYGVKRAAIPSIGATE
uniref:hypothetical protein n=1 Tax=Pedobacter schmidteae TaxID=2201271 RepID=UPI000EB4D8C6|nr:hypothetical protein [Pedobacter schmidteae]